MSSLQSICNELTGRGAPFEIVVEDVLGEEMKVFANRPRSLRQLLDASAAFDSQEYLIFGDRRITYGEHRSIVARVASALSEKYEIGPGDRVAILAANSPEWIFSFWAVTSLGAIVVAMNGWWAADEIRHALADSEPRLLLGDRKRLARLAEIPDGLPIVEFESDFESMCFGSASLPSWTIDEDAPACILYTSGTTGRAKGAMLSHRAIIAGVGLQTLNGAVMFMARGSRVSPEPPCTLLTTPLFHVSGLVAGAVMMLSAGAKVVMLEGRFEPAEVMRWVEREKVTTWSSTPTMAHRVVNHPELDRYDLRSLSNLGSGGSALSADLQRTIRETFPDANIGLGYGLTESGGVATINSGSDLQDRPTSSGQPMPCVELEIRDENGDVLPDGREGEICLRSPLLMLGYWRNEKATEEAIGPRRWLRTGDIGHVRDGHLYVNSRARDLILRGGENIYPIEVEQALEAHPSVDEAAIFGVEHEELGQEVHAVVVPASGKELSSSELVDWLKDRIAGFKIPTIWTLRAEPLPRNASGKVLKPVLSGAHLTLVEDQEQSMVE